MLAMLPTSMVVAVTPVAVAPPLPPAGVRLPLAPQGAAADVAPRRPRRRRWRPPCWARCRRDRPSRACPADARTAPLPPRCCCRAPWSSWWCWRSSSWPSTWWWSTSSRAWPSVVVVRCWGWCSRRRSARRGGRVGDRRGGVARCAERLSASPAGRALGQSGLASVEARPAGRGQEREHGDGERDGDALVRGVGADRGERGSPTAISSWSCRPVGAPGLVEAAQNALEPVDGADDGRARCAGPPRPGACSRRSARRCRRRSPAPRRAGRPR